MRYAISVTKTALVHDIERSGLEVLDVLNHFISELSKITRFQNPRGIVFHDLDSATQLYSTVPLPAYTSRDLIHLTPLTDVWKRIFLSATKNIKEAKLYYSQLKTLDVALIAAHELTHHSDFFHSDFDDIDEESMWFEEGMCEYIPRRLMMTDTQVNKIMEIERQQIAAYEEDYGNYLLTEFGAAGYRSGKSDEYSAAFYDYWRSTKVVQALVEKHCDHDLLKLIACYTEWVNGERGVPLHTFFKLRFNMTNSESKSLWLSS